LCPFCSWPGSSPESKEPLTLCAKPSAFAAEILTARKAECAALEADGRGPRVEEVRVPGQLWNEVAFWSTEAQDVEQE